MGVIHVLTYYIGLPGFIIGVILFGIYVANSNRKT